MSIETAECKNMAISDVDKTWESNRKYFLDHEQEYEGKYPGKYIAIHEGKILGTHVNLGTLADQIYTTKGNIPFYADIPGEQETIIFDYPIIL